MKLSVTIGTDYQLPTGRYARCVAIEHHQVSFVYCCSGEPVAIPMQHAWELWGHPAPYAAFEGAAS